MADGTQNFGIFGQRFRMVEDEAGFVERIDGVKEQFRTGVAFSRLNAKMSFEAAGHYLPQSQSMSVGMIDKHGHVAFRRAQIADSERERACRRAQDITEGQRMTDCDGRR